MPLETVERELKKLRRDITLPRSNTGGRIRCHEIHYIPPAEVMNVLAKLAITDDNAFGRREK